MLASVIAAAGLLAAALPAAAAQGPGAPPAVPTTKILAVGRLSGHWTAETRAEVMPKEVRATVELYLKGKIDQWYFRKDQIGVVFLMNVTDPAEAHALLEDLPLGRAGLMTFDLIPLGPLAPLGLLTAAPAG